MDTDGKKKRKLDPAGEDPRNQSRRNVEEEEEEDEEKKIEMFYALIRRSRETRERLIRHDREGEGERKNIMAWNPKFRLEDFEDSHVTGTRIARDDRDKASPSRNVGRPLTVVFEEDGEGREKKDDDKEETKGKGIDLNLSL